MTNKNLKIIAGPCSISKENTDEVFEIANIRVGEGDKRAVWGVRVVGLKSRTYMSEKEEEMGMDFLNYKKNVKSFISNAGLKDFLNYKSVDIAKKIIKETGVVIATEVVDPLIQLPVYEKNIPKNKLFIWNPAVNQLGYQTYIMGIYAKRNNWYIGIKNPKWYSKESGNNLNTMEKTWEGQISYASSERDRYYSNDKVFLIHRGVDVKEKKKMRNLLVHKSVEKIKERNKINIFFDPSHSFGPLLRKNIVKETIKAMKLKINGNYLYSGILIEVGNSKTDTKQHITIKEFKELAFELSKFRKIEN